VDELTGHAHDSGGLSETREYEGDRAGYMLRILNLDNLNMENCVGRFHEHCGWRRYGLSVRIPSILLSHALVAKMRPLGTPRPFVLSTLFFIKKTKEHF
jgi:hypothetical protein